MLSTSADRCYSQIGNTPLRAAELRIAGHWRPVNLKLEGANPMGSSKDRTAAALLRDLDRRGLLKPSSVILESTSGNLGVSLAFLTQQLGYRLRAVIDPKITKENRDRMLSYGAQLDLVEKRDETGSYLLSRLERIRELCARSKRYVWTDQYSNPANPDAHYRATAPEIYRQMRNRVDAIFVAVSTGGTLAGIGRYFREVSPSTQIVGVDAAGSVIFGTKPHPRKLTGIGSSRPSVFLSPSHFDTYALVEDRNAFAMCRQMSVSIGLSLGGSSGAVLSACAQYLWRNPDARHVVCVCPDMGANYLSTIYSDSWLSDNGFTPDGHMDLVEDIAETPARASSF